MRHGQLVVVEDLALAGVLDPVGHLLDRRVQAVDRDEADRRVFRTVAIGGDIALADLHREFHADLRAVIQRADHQLRVQDLAIASHLDVAGANLAGALLAQRHPLRAIGLHAHGDGLDVQDDVGDILANARDRRELMQHAVDLDGGDGRALERGQQHAAQGVAERHAEAALERFSDERRDALRVVPGRRLRAWSA